MKRSVRFYPSYNGSQRKLNGFGLGGGPRARWHLRRLLNHCRCINAKVVVVPPKSSLPKAVEWPEVRPLGCFLLPAAAWSQNSQPQTELTSRQRPLHSRAVDLSPLSLHPASGKAHACGPRACRKGVGQSHTSLLCLRRRKPPPLRRVPTP